MNHIKIALQKEAINQLYNDFSLVESDYGRNIIMDAIMKYEGDLKKLEKEECAQETPGARK